MARATTHEDIDHILEEGARTYLDLLVETPERLAKLREIFKVGGTPTELDTPGRPLHPGLPEKVFQAVTKADPTAKVDTAGNVVKCGIYSQWMLQRYLTASPPAQTRFAEDCYRLADLLRVYDKNKSRLPVEQRNIAAVKSEHDLRQIVKPFTDAAEAAEKAKQQASDKGVADTTVILDGPAYKVVVPLSKESAIYWGSDTEWCTADERDDWNRYEGYAKEGPLYIAISKADPAVKFQFHLESSQFMDAEDSQIDVEDFFAGRPEVGAAIVKHRDAQGISTALLDLERLAPDAVFERYQRASNTDKLVHLRTLSCRMILNGLAANAWGAADLNAVQKSIRFDAGDSLVGSFRVGFVFDNLIDAQYFMAEGGRNRSPRVGFREIVNGNSDFTDYGGGPDISHCKDSINNDNTERIQRICFSEEALDEDGDIQWNALPDRVESAILGHWADGESQAQESAYYNAYVEALEEVLGTLKHESDGKVVFWNSLESFQQIVTDTLEDENDEYRHTPLDELEDHYQKLLDAGDSLADPGDLNGTQGDADVEEFNTNLAADLEEMDPGPEAEAGLRELLDRGEEEEAAKARLYEKDDEWTGLGDLASKIAADRGIGMENVSSSIRELVVNEASFRKYCARYLWPSQVEQAVHALYDARQESVSIQRILQ